MISPNILNAIIAVFVIQLMIQNQQHLLLVLCYWRFYLLQMQVLLQQRRYARQRRFRIHPYWTLPRPKESWFDIHFYRRDIPEDLFYRQMRMKRGFFDQILARLHPYLVRENTKFRNCVPPEKVLAIGLYRLAHGGSFENSGIAMNVGVSTVFEAFEDVVNALFDLRNNYIKFPMTVAEKLSRSQLLNHFLTFQTSREQSMELIFE